MKEDLYDDLYEEKEEKIDFHALLFRYVIRWPWFVASVIICLAGAWLHLRQTTPVYNISASVIIKDDKKGATVAEICRARGPGAGQLGIEHRQRD